MRKNTRRVCALAAALLTCVFASCNDGLMGATGEPWTGRTDRSQRTVIDSQEYVDFTTVAYNAQTHRREDLLIALGGKTYYNGNSYIKIDKIRGTIEMSSDRAFYRGKGNAQMYAKFGLETKAASSDCLYIRRNPRVEGMLALGPDLYTGDEIPDLAVCLPLYGYSKNRIEVSSVMNGFIAMPSGTYWVK